MLGSGNTPPTKLDDDRGLGQHPRAVRLTPQRLNQAFFSPVTAPKLTAFDALVAGPIPAEAERVGEGSPALTKETLQQERRRVAQVLHDTVCQELAGLHLVLGALAHQYQVSCPEVAEKLQVLTGRIQLASSTLNDFMHALRTEDTGAS